MQLTSEIKVEVVQQMGSDLLIAQAAQTSTQQTTTDNPEKTAGLINYLLQHRHGTPFEHGSITFQVHAPIFVWREHHRHRVGFSYNENSARYTQLDPTFYVPPPQRNIIPVPDPGNECKNCGGEPIKLEAGRKSCPSCGKEYLYHTSARPLFGPGTPDQYQSLIKTLQSTYTLAYQMYENMIQDGYAKEVARNVLPVAIYSTCWVTCNPRSLMHFLSLRTVSANAKIKSFPQWEIQQVANQYENQLRNYWPLTHKAFDQNGRIAP